MCAAVCCTAGKRRSVASGLRTGRAAYVPTPLSLITDLLCPGAMLEITGIEFVVISAVSALFAVSAAVLLLIQLA